VRKKDPDGIGSPSPLLTIQGRSGEKIPKTPLRHKKKFSPERRKNGALPVLPGKTEGIDLPTGGGGKELYISFLNGRPCKRGGGKFGNGEGEGKKRSGTKKDLIRSRSSHRNLRRTFLKRLLKKNPIKRKKGDPPSSTLGNLLPNRVCHRDPSIPEDPINPKRGGGEKIHHRKEDRLIRKGIPEILHRVGNIPKPPGHCRFFAGTGWEGKKEEKKEKDGSSHPHHHNRKRAHHKKVLKEKRGFFLLYENFTNPIPYIMRHTHN